jgi:hypothetical protein
MLSVPPSLNAIVSAAGKNTPVFESPVGDMAGEVAVPVPLVIKVVATRVGIVPVVIVAAVEVVVPAVRVVMVAAVDVVVPNVPVSIVPVVILAVGRVWAKLATVMRFRALESEASPISTVSLEAITVSAVRS